MLAPDLPASLPFSTRIAEVLRNSGWQPSRWPYLQHLPVEVIAMILEELDASDLRSCKKVCCMFRDIIQRSVAIRYKFELAAVGMMDGPSGGLSRAERKAKLRDLQKGWLNLKFCSTWSVPCAGVCWSYSAGIFAQVSEAGAIDLYQVPSAIKGIPEKRWLSSKHKGINLSIFMFEVDHAQDLVVFVELGEELTGHLHPRLLSKPSEPHPLAVHSRLLALPFPDDCACCLYVQGDIVGWLVCDFEEQVSSLQLWNWKTGILVWHLYCQSPHTFATSFVFLDERHLILAVLDKLYVYAFNPQSNFTHIRGTQEGYLYAMKLPPIAEGATPLRTMIFAQNNWSMQPHPNVHVPFHTRDKHVLFMVVMVVGRQMQEDEEQPATFVVFLPAPIVFKYLGMRGGPELYPNYSWDKWGPSGTRIIEVHSRYLDWFCDVRGSRGLVAFMEDMDKAELTVDVYEVNPLIVKSGFERLAEDQLPPTTTYVTEPSKIVALEYFRDELVTSLPYRVSRTHVNTILTGHEAVDQELLMDALLMEDGLLVMSSDTCCQFFTL